MGNINKITIKTNSKTVFAVFVSLLYQGTKILIIRKRNEVQ